jgi:uncharacterized protein with GYD domain
VFAELLARRPFDTEDGLRYRELTDEREAAMPKYMWQASYAAEGVKGVLKEGGSGRRAAIQKLTENLGGRLEAFYFAFGSDDVIVIADLPDQRTAAAIGLAVNADGHTSLKTVVLLTPEEIDEAVKTAVDYRPPGG